MKRLLIGIVVLLMVGCFNNNRDSKEVVKNGDAIINVEDVQKFKAEVEALNGTKYVSVSVGDDSRIIYTTEEDVLNLENGIVLFGWASCPWFRNAIEPLLEFAYEEKASIYYLNIYDIRDRKELKDEQVVTTKEGTPGYYAILERFHDILNPYTGLEDESIKRISSPTVLFIKDKIGVHKVFSTVVSQEDPYTKLTAEQHNELKQRYKHYFVDEKTN